jgi:2-keto-3-deoxy-6-phosphogluconate aldolase
VNSYKRNRTIADKIIRKSGVVVVMNKKHVRNAEDLIATMHEVHQAGFVAECTFRIDLGIVKEAMKELVRLRSQYPDNNQFILGVGSIINPEELEAAIEMGFDMVVAPGNVMGSFGEGKEFVKICHEADVFCAPAVFTPTELQYFLERGDSLEPDAIKVFPANTYGDEGIKALLAPFVRKRHHWKIIMPTGGVNFETGQKFHDAISSNGFTPILGMSSPLSLVEKENKPGNIEIIRKSLKEFKDKFNLVHN